MPRAGAVHVDVARVLQGRPGLHHHVRPEQPQQLPQLHQVEERCGGQVLWQRRQSHPLHIVS